MYYFYGWALVRLKIRIFLWILFFNWIEKQVWMQIKVYVNAGLLGFFRILYMIYWLQGRWIKLVAVYALNVDILYWLTFGATTCPILLVACRFFGWWIISSISLSRWKFAFKILQNVHVLGIFEINWLGRYQRPYFVVFYVLDGLTSVFIPFVKSSVNDRHILLNLLVFLWFDHNFGYTNLFLIHLF